MKKLVILLLCGIVTVLYSANLTQNRASFGKNANAHKNFRSTAKDVNMSIVDGRVWIYTKTRQGVTIGVAGGLSVKEYSKWQKKYYAFIDKKSASIVKGTGFYDVVPYNVRGEDNLRFAPATTTVDDNSGTSIVIPAEFNGRKVTTLGVHAFYKISMACPCEIIIPEGVKAIESPLVDDSCMAISLTIPASVETIQNGAFQCGIKSVTMSPKNSKFKIVDNMLCTRDGKRLLKQIGVYNQTTKIPQGVISIDNRAGVSGSTVIIPSSVKSIGKRAIYARVIQIDKNPNFKVVDGILYSQDGKRIIVSEREAYHRTSIVIPKGVKSITEAAFFTAEVSSISLPDGLVFIGASAFEFSKCQKIIIPESVKMIEVDAFGGSEGMEIIFKGPPPATTGGIVDYYRGGTVDYHDIYKVKGYYPSKYKRQWAAVIDKKTSEWNNLVMEMRDDD